MAGSCRRAPAACTRSSCKRADRPRGGVHAVELPGQADGAQGRRSARRRLLDHRQAAGGDSRLAAPASSDTFADAGLPDGVLNIVYGNPPEISGYLIPHPIIRKISFTGSTAVGKQLAALAGTHMKRATMELGGHAPAIVFDDADIDAAAAQLWPAPSSAMPARSASSPTRFLVQENVYDALPRQVRRACQRDPGRRRPGRGHEMGPLANERRVDAMERLIDEAVSDGAKIETGGKRIGNKGYFFEPTVLSGVQLRHAHHERGAVRPGRADRCRSRASTTSSPRPTGCPMALPPTLSPAPPRR